MSREPLTSMAVYLLMIGGRWDGLLYPSPVPIEQSRAELALASGPFDADRPCRMARYVHAESRASCDGAILVYRFAGYV